MKRVFIIFLTILALFFASCSKQKKPVQVKQSNPDSTPEMVIDNSLNLISEGNNFSVNIISQKDGLISNNIRNILFDSESILCLADQGIIRIFKKSGRINNYSPFEKNTKFISMSKINNTIFIHNNKRVYRFTENKAEFVCEHEKIAPYLFKYNDKVSFLTLDGRLYTPISGKSNHIINIITNISISLVQQYDNDIIISDKQSLYNYDLKKNRLYRLLTITNDSINHFIKEDKYIFFGRQILYQYDIEKKRLKTITTIASNNYLTYIYKDMNNFYIGQNKGITLLNMNDISTTQILDKFAVKDSYINYIAKEENILWIGTRNNGIIKYIE